MKRCRFILFFYITIIAASCNNTEKPEVFDPNRNYSGEELARIYCGGCHQYPEPNFLSKEIWDESVLPEMGMKLGIFDPNIPFYSSKRLQFNNGVSISDSNWQKIRKFYIENAIIPAEKDTNKYSNTDLFKPITPAYNFLPFVTAIKYDKKLQQLHVGSDHVLYTLDSNLIERDSVRFPSPITDIHIYSDKKEILSVGIIHPNDLKQGSLFVLDPQTQEFELLMDSLRRPVQFASLDLNNDGVAEKVVCEFGNDEGELSILKQVEGGFEKVILSRTPGARRVIGYDFDKNGFLDLMVQFAQGDERVSIFYNDHMKFTEKVIARFPPVYGSSSFDTLDWNNDGKLDFYCVFGDNADLSIMLKEYHGLRIFENNGKNQFNETLFFPIYGATDAKGFDFDQDGDLDFAIIAHFADYDNAPQNSFIYLENKNGKLHSFIIPDLPDGRWLTIETGDYDNDGDEDIFIGSFKYLSRFTLTNNKTLPPIVILQNQHISK